MEVLAALGGALFIGTADFLGGVASRRINSLLAALCINLVALFFFAVAWVSLTPHLNTKTALLGVLAGFISAAGLNLIYAAFAAGAMSLIAPLLACGTGLVPTAMTAVIGDPPSPLQCLGIACSLAGVVAITWTRPASVDHVPLSRRALILTAAAALVTGASFSVALLATRDGTVPQAIGVAALNRVTATAICVVLVVVLLRGTRLQRPPLRPILGAGTFESIGVMLFLTASTMGNSGVVAVIVSLYAMVTVLLAQTVLRERIAVHQRIGIGAAAIGVALLSLG